MALHRSKQGLLFSRMNWKIVGSNYVEAQSFAHFVHIAIVRIDRNLFLYAGDARAADQISAKPACRRRQLEDPCQIDSHE